MNQATAARDDAGLFQQIVRLSRRIVVTAHTSPDPDAVCSALLLGEILKYNFPYKDIQVVLEEQPKKDLSFLQGYETIAFMPIVEALEKIKPDVFIMTDVSTYDRVSRYQSQTFEKLLHEQAIKTIIVDHHDSSAAPSVDCMINTGSSAAAQEVYTLCFNQLSWKRPPGYAPTAMLGLISDTNRFMYHRGDYRAVFDIAGTLLQDGANIEQLEQHMSRFNPAELRMIAHLAANLSQTTEYTYSFVTDEFTHEWMGRGDSVEDFKGARDWFGNQFLRNVGGCNWGFVVYPEPTAAGIYYVSFRSVMGGRNVRELAKALGGNGHIPAAGAQFKAPDIKSALTLVESSIKQLV